MKLLKLFEIIQNLSEAQFIKGLDFPVWKNPTYRDMIALLRTAWEMRGFVSGDNLYVFNALDATHPGGAEILQKNGVIPDAYYDRPMNVYFRETHGNPSEWMNDLRKAGAFWFAAMDTWSEHMLGPNDPEVRRYKCLNRVLPPVSMIQA